MLKRITVIVCLLFIVATSSAFAQGAGAFVGSTSKGVPSLGDPCLSFPHQSAPLALPSATTSKVISGVSGLKTYICSIGAVIITGATAGLSYGTGTLCATNITTLTGPMAASTLQPNSASDSDLVAPAGVDVCVVGTGAGADVAGWVTYVQSPR
ncbi:MAG: hypothetical protein KGJ90_01885 [Patescibacteria group bacterium]|nr:hypothetical protein [Patescibacteria group bacterium]